MGKLIEKAMKAGWLIRDRGMPAQRCGGARPTVWRKVRRYWRPFAETRELIGGFAIIQATSKQDAIEHTKYALEVAGGSKMAGGSETEIRQLYEAPAAASGKP